MNLLPGLLAMFLLGLFGTGHCVGMCGPLTIAFPRGPFPKRLPGVGAASRSASMGRTLAMLPLGLAMGRLPCGLSYAAFARTLPAGGAAPGALMALAFGAGTLPGLLVFGTAATRLFLRHRRHLDIVAAVIMVGMAVDLLVDLATVWH